MEVAGRGWGEAGSNVHVPIQEEIWGFGKWNESLSKPTFSIILRPWLENENHQAWASGGERVVKDADVLLEAKKD